MFAGRVLLGYDILFLNGVNRIIQPVEQTGLYIKR